MTATPQEAFKERVEAAKRAEGARMLECRCRNNSGCTLVSARLGWSHGLPLEDCDVCWALGGEKNPDALQFRERLTAATLGVMTRNALESPKKPTRDILVALTVLHRTIDEERFKSPDIQNAVKGPVRWTQVKSTWEKATSLLKALGSKTVWRLSPTTRNARQIACFGSQLDGLVVAPPCQLLKKSSDGYYCGACGCGAHEIARLGSLEKKGIGEPSKLDYPSLECPLKKQGFTNADCL